MRKTKDEILHDFELQRTFNYEVHVGIGRWCKKGEIHDGIVVGHERCYRTAGKCLAFYCFNNAEEAFEFAEQWRGKFLKHIEGKKLEYKNDGIDMFKPFNEENLLKNQLDGYTDVWHDYRYIEILPYSWNISITKTIYSV